MMVNTIISILILNKIIEFSSSSRPPIEIFINDKPYKVDPAFTVW
jgi:hypothetical protein